MLQEVEKARHALEGLQTLLEETIAPLMMRLESDPIGDNLDAYFELKEISEVADSIRKMFGHVAPVLSERIRNLMGGIGESLDREYNGRTFRVKPDVKTHVSVTQANERRAVEWFKADPEGRELVKESVHSKTMESFVKKKAEEGAAIPADIFTVYMEQTLSIRKLPAKKD